MNWKQNVDTPKGLIFGSFDPILAYVGRTLTQAQSPKFWFDSWFAHPCVCTWREHLYYTCLHTFNV